MLFYSSMRPPSLLLWFYEPWEKSIWWQYEIKERPLAHTMQQFTLPLVFLVDLRRFQVTCNETRNLPHESELLCVESESVCTESTSICTESVSFHAEYGQSVCHYLHI